MRLIEIVTLIHTLCKLNVNHSWIILLPLSVTFSRQYPEVAEILGLSKLNSCVFTPMMTG